MCAVKFGKTDGRIFGARGAKGAFWRVREVDARDLRGGGRKVNRRGGVGALSLLSLFLSPSTTTAPSPNAQYLGRVARVDVCRVVHIASDKPGRARPDICDEQKRRELARAPARLEDAARHG